MKIAYYGDGCKGPMGRFIKGGIYDISDDLALELLKRPGFSIYKEKSKKEDMNIGIMQKDFVEKAIKNKNREVA